MTITSIRFGDFTLETGVGVTLINHKEGRSVYFQPGDDAGDFHDRLDAMDTAQPDVAYEAHLSAIWSDYAHVAA